MRYDDSFDLPPVPDNRLWFYGGTLGAATGALAGGVEAFVLALTLHLPMSIGESFVLGLTTILLDAAVGACAGIVSGFGAQVTRANALRWRRYRTSFTATTLLLCLFFFLPLTRDLWRQGRPQAAVGMIALSAVFGILAWFNSGYWFRRDLIGAAPRLGWRGVAPLVALGLVLFGVLLRGPSGPLEPPVPGVPNLILVTIDTLRRDHLGTYGSLLRTPVIDALGASGVVYEDAMTALPETLPSHASMLTGLQPSVHEVVSNGMPLRPGFLTVAEQLDIGGYRSGAFVSSFAVDGASGIAQGFHVYDDDFFPLLRGVTETRVAATALPLLMRFGDPTKFPFLLERGSPETIRRALRWVDEDERPFFLWVHLFDPHSPYEPRDGRIAEVDHRAILAQEPGYPYTEAERTALRKLYAEEVEYTDQMVDLLLTGLRERGALENATVLFTADHGESLGEHGIDFNHHGVYDTVLRVPMILWSTDARATAGTRIDRMVDVADVANTLIAASGMPLLSKTGSVPLLSHVDGDRVPPQPTFIQGRVGASLSEGQLCGIRSPRSVKYILGQEGREELYDLVADPGELRNLAEDQPAVAAAAKASVDAHGCGTVTTSGADNATMSMLEALGYADGPQEGAPPPGSLPQAAEAVQEK